MWYIKMALTFICDNLKVFFASVLIACVSSIIIMHTVQDIGERTQFYRDVDESLKSPIDEYYYGFVVREQREYIDEKYPDLIEAYANTEPVSDGSSFMILPTSTEVFDFELVEGDSFENVKLDDDIYYYAYLGYNNHDYKVGDVVTNMSNEIISDSKHKIKVLGRLKKNTLVPNTEEYFKLSTDDFIRAPKGYTKVDDTFIIGFADYRSEAKLVKINPKYSQSDVEKILRECSNAVNMRIRLARLDEFFEMSDVINLDEVNELKKLLVIVVINVIVIIAIIQMNLTYRRKNYYGVYISSGLSKKDIVKCMAIESLIKYIFIMLLSVMMYICFMILDYKMSYMTSGLGDYILNKTFWTYTIYWLAIFEFVVVMLSSIMSLQYINRKTTINLMEEIR